MKPVLPRYAIQVAQQPYDPWWRVPVLGLSVIVGLINAMGVTIAVPHRMIVLAIALSATTIAAVITFTLTCDPRSCLPKPARRFLHATWQERERLENRCTALIRARNNDTVLAGVLPDGSTLQVGFEQRVEALQAEVDAYVERFRAAAGPSLPIGLRRERKQLRADAEELRRLETEIAAAELGSDAVEWQVASHLRATIERRCRELGLDPEKLLPPLQLPAMRARALPPDGLAGSSSGRSVPSRSAR